MRNTHSSQDAQAPGTESNAGELTRSPMVRYDAQSRDLEFFGKSQRPESDSFSEVLRNQEKSSSTDPENKQPGSADLWDKSEVYEDLSETSQ